jgi:Pyridoxal-dependent decarboxylase conserved domain
MVDYIADYLQNIRSRRVFPDVSPGYMRHLVPDSAPDDGEQWTTIFKDIERVVMPGVSIDASLLREAVTLRWRETLSLATVLMSTLRSIEAATRRPY